MSLKRKRGRDDSSTASSGNWQVTADKKPSGSNKSGKMRGQDDSNNELNHKDLSFVLYELDDSLLLCLRFNQAVTFKGKVDVRCLNGAFEVNGYVIVASDTKIFSLYSPSTNSFMRLEAKRGVSNVAKDIENVFTQFGITDKQKRSQLRKNYACLLCKAESSGLNFATQFAPFQNIFRSGSNSGTQIDFEVVTEGTYCVTLPDSHTAVVDTIVQAADNVRVLLCGGKNVGKSTLARHLVNKLLTQCTQVAYMECDIGQTELTPSGCVSLHIITEPLLGPPFTHQRVAHMSCYTGCLSAADNPQLYTECVSHVYNSYTQLADKCPLVVNTMGWNKGLGLALLVDIVRLVCPTHVVQLDSSSTGKNMSPITTHYINTATSFTDSVAMDTVASRKTRLTFDLHRLDSAVSSKQESEEKFKAPDHRTLATLVYFSRMFEGQGQANVGDLLAIDPYVIPWDKVAVTVFGADVPNSQIMYSLNGSLVALCVCPTDFIVDTSIEGLPKFLSHPLPMNCLGFGIVRSINPVTKTFHIVAPLSRSDLHLVNCLVKGTLTLPDCVYMAQGLGDVPYVGVSKDVIGAVSIKPRRHLLRRSSLSRQ